MTYATLQADVCVFTVETNRDSHRAAMGSLYPRAGKPAGLPRSCRWLRPEGDTEKSVAAARV